MTDKKYEKKEGEGALWQESEAEVLLQKKRRVRFERAFKNTNQNYQGV